MLHWLGMKSRVAMKQSLCPSRWPYNFHPWYCSIRPWIFWPLAKLQITVSVWLWWSPNMSCQANTWRWKQPEKFVGFHVFQSSQLGLGQDFPHFFGDPKTYWCFLRREWGFMIQNSHIAIIPFLYSKSLGFPKNQVDRLHPTRRCWVSNVPFCWGFVWNTHQNSQSCWRWVISPRNRWLMFLENWGHVPSPSTQQKSPLPTSPSDTARWASTTGWASWTRTRFWRWRPWSVASPRRPPWRQVVEGEKKLW